MKEYHINVFFSDEDQSWVAEIPDLRPCSAFGDSPEEAVRQVQIAKEGWLASARQRGYPIPVPKYKPSGYQAAS